MHWDSILNILLQSKLLLNLVLLEKMWMAKMLAVVSITQALLECYFPLGIVAMIYLLPPINAQDTRIFQNNLMKMLFNGSVGISKEL